MKKRFLLIIVLTFTMLCSAIGFVACSDNNSADNNDAEIYAVYRLYANAQFANGNSALTYSQWLENIKGEKGTKGADGQDGVGIVSIVKTASDGLDDIYTITFTDNTTSTFVISNGKKGDKGDKGQDGANGENGLSAYEIWLAAGHDGSESDFLEWLKGETGANGKDGKSAYDIWLDKGNVGSETDFLAWLKGSDGIVPILRINATSNIWEVSYDNGETYTSLGVKATGENGTNGTNGSNGENGADGITPRLRINAANNVWEVSYDNGETYSSLGVKATGENGTNGTNGSNGENGKSAYEIWLEQGNVGSETDFLAWLKGSDGIVPILRINATSNIWEVSYDNGETYTSLGVKATGENGTNGTNGSNGENGADGITPILRINAASNVWEVSYDNGETYTSLGVKATGESGTNGTNGSNGENGKSAYEIWLEQGNVGSETDFLAWLKGESGTNGVGVSGTQINDDGDLIISLTDGSFVNLGNIAAVHPHTIIEKEVVERAPTTTQEGITHIICETCHEVLKTIIVDKLPYDGEEESFIGPIDIASGSVYRIHTDLQLAYLNDDVTNVSAYASGTVENSVPEPVKLTWTAVSGAVIYYVFVSENADLSDGFTVSSSTNSVDVYNCKARTTYYYQIISVDNNSEMKKSSILSFMTDATLPRIIKCDGITNMRDLGGYIVNNGTQVIKQGMLYRSGRLNTSKPADGKLNVEITAEGISTMLNVLKIKSEIDLRRPLSTDNGYETGYLNGKSVLGNSVNYYHCGMEWSNGGEYQEANFPSIRQFFSYLADESNYPLFFHCDIGTDRTGFMAYLLGAILGMEKEDLQRNYLMSNFGNIGGSRALSRISKYANDIDACEGETLAGKAVNFLINVIGVSMSDIESIRSIMLEDCSFVGTVLIEPTATKDGLKYWHCNEDDSKSYFEILTVSDYVVPVEELFTPISDVELPSGYVKKTYLESDGSAYIDTGYKPTSDIRTIAKLNVPVASSDNNNSFYAFGCRDNSNVNMYGLSTWHSGDHGKYGSGDHSVMESGITSDFIIDFNKNSLTLKSTSNDVIGQYTFEEQSFSCNYSMFIYGMNNKGSRYSNSTTFTQSDAKMKVYYMVILNADSEVIHYYVPCLRSSDNVAGLYDVKTNTFLTNSGSGSFNVG